MDHHIGTHLLTTAGTHLVRPTEKYLESTLEAASADFSGPTSTGDLDKYADFIATAITTAVDKAIPKSKNERFETNPISEKRMLRGQYSAQINPIHGGGGGCFPPPGQ